MPATALCQQPIREHQCRAVFQMPTREAPTLANLKTEDKQNHLVERMFALLTNADNARIYPTQTLFAVVMSLHWLSVDYHD